MTGSFEQVKTRILQDSAENGGPNTRDLVDLIAASHSDNAAEHVEMVTSMNRHIAKLNGMETRSMDVASNFTAVLATPQFTTFIDGRDRKIDEAIAGHVVARHQPDEEIGELKRSWKQFKWVFVFIGIPVLIILAQQVGNIIFGGPT